MCKWKKCVAFWYKNIYLEFTYLWIADEQIQTGKEEKKKDGYKWLHKNIKSGIPPKISYVYHVNICTSFLEQWRC